MSESQDLTRWNRAGLSRFRYVDGNAVEYLEILRQQLVAKFGDKEKGRCEWISSAVQVPENEAAPESETLIQTQERLSRRQERILQAYHQDRRDWAWEITRTFARACHVLTEHSNAYANEAYLGTATQWDHVRRLVEMLDYHPAPPASATTTLVFMAKENKSGFIPRGFQVKYSPPQGGAKVIFETLQDLRIDAALNGLRPKGWNQSQEPVADDGNEETDLTAPECSAVFMGPAINIQGVGEISAGLLNDSLLDPLLDPPPEPSTFRIVDFLELDPENSRLGIEETWLREWKTKATILSRFAPEGDWSALAEMLLPEIAQADPETLQEKSGNTLQQVLALQHNIEIVGICLDQLVYIQTRLKKLFACPPGGAQAVSTFWVAKAKPKVGPEDVVMVCRMTKDDNGNSLILEAEAASIKSTAIVADDPSCRVIDLVPSPVQRTWPQWSKGESSLQVAPRWQRKCWINGTGVIHTKEPHGLTPGTFIGWDATKKSTGVLNTSAIKYAKILKVDKNSLQVDYKGDLPDEFTELIQLRPITGEILSADYAAIVLLAGDGGADNTSPAVVDVPLAVGVPAIEGRPRPDEIFKLKKFIAGPAPEPEPPPSVPLLPPAALPKIGCFLFPSPLLPVDLVKAAVELMLSLGVMAIPSTEKIVIKGMPFEGLLNSENPPVDAATNLFNMLDGLIGTYQKCDSDGKPYWHLTPSGETSIDPADPSAPANYLRIPGPNGVLVPVPVIVTGKLVEWTVLETNASGGAGGSAGGGAGAGAAAAPLSPSEIAQIKTALADMLGGPEGGESTSLFKKIEEDLSDKGPLLAIPSEPGIVAEVDAPNPLYMFNGEPDKIVEGDWVVGRFSDGLRALSIKAIQEIPAEDETKSFSLEFDKLDGSQGVLQKVYADFRGEFVLKDATINISTIDSNAIELDGELSASLKVGSTVLLTADGETPVAATVASISGNTITTNPSAGDYKKGSLIIRGNVVLAGHGETKPEKILGSGAAAKSNQEFTLDVDQLAFIPDPTMSSGVAASIEVEVAGQVWQQVSTLKDSTPGDPHYAIRMTEEGYVKILFGDGQFGRRLPSGKNNIRVRYRVGTGLVGNVSAGKLEKPVKPHPAVSSVQQPLNAAGGGDMEDLTSLRENAPPTVLALERAVSLSDFSHLAKSQSSVWQAKAYRRILHGGKKEIVNVIIVPAGGIDSAEIRKTLRRFLEQHSLPGVQVTVDPFEEQRFSLSIAVRIKTEEFNAELVKQAVSAALVDHFALKNRALGEYLYLSEVIQIVEAVQGVENSICVLNDEAGLSVIKANNESCVVYLDTLAEQTPSNLKVTVEEYLP